MTRYSLVTTLSPTGPTGSPFPSTFRDGLVSRLTTFQIYASPYTPEFCNWAFAYEKYQDRFNAPGTSLSDAENISVDPLVLPPAHSAHDTAAPSAGVNLAAEPSTPGSTPAIDIMLTHGPPYSRRDVALDGNSVGCPHTLAALARFRPRLHCFGHIHEGAGAENIHWSRVPAHLGADLSDIPMRDFKTTWKSHTLQACIEHPPRQRRLCNGRVVELASPSLVPGQQTLLLNAALVDIHYRVKYPTWLLRLDLASAAI